MLRILCLGQFRVETGIQPIEIPSRPAQSLFAYLTLNAGRVHRREMLAGLLWPDSSDENARGYLRQGLWRIRKALESAGVPWQDYFQIDEISVSYKIDSGAFIDAEFLLQQKTGEDWSIEELEERVQIYTGELLPGFYDEWTILERERLKSAYDQKMRLLLNQFESAARWDDLLEWSERWVAMGHIPEPAYRALMIAHAVQGDTTGVTIAFQRCKKNLLEELGVAPSKELCETYQQLVQGIIPERALRTAPHIHQIAAAPPAPGNSPYKGLEHFDREDANLFFGREQIVTRLVTRLEENRLIAVVGASGSGKSSIIRAGLVPALQARRTGGLAQGEDRCWQVGIMTPSTRPLFELACLLREGKDYQAEFIKDPHTLERSLCSRTAGSNQQRYLLVVDQLEEVFTLCESETERIAFLDNLLAVGEALSGSGAVVLVLRADFYEQCGRYPALRQALSRHQEYIGPMTTEELRSAIEQPALRSGWHFEPGLVDLILRDVRGEPGALPLLSHALLETWKRRNGHWLTLRGYAEASGVHGAIAHTADFVYNRQLSREQQITARNIFLRLTELREDLTGTRRRASPTEFTTLAASPELVEETLNILTAARLVIRSENGVEVAHEALIMEWPTLHQWLAEDRLGLRLHHHLAEASRQWDSLGRDPGELYRGARLAQVVEWAGNHPDRLNTLEREFLQAGRVEEERLQLEKDQQQQREIETARQLAASEKKRAEQQLTSNRRLRLFTAVITLVFLVTLAAAWVAVEQRNHANRTTYLAHSRELAAAALNYLEIDPQLSILLALEAVNESRVANVPVSAETESVLHQAVRLSRQAHVIHAGQNGVYGVSFSPDGRMVCTAGQDGSLKLWDAQDWSLARTLLGHTGETQGCSFNPNGRWVVSSSRDHTIRGWDLDTGREIWSYPDMYDLPLNLAHSPDGSQLAAAMYEGRILILDAISGLLVHEIVTLPKIVSVAYDPWGLVIGVVDNGGMVQLFDARTYEELEKLETKSKSQGFISFSPDGKKMAIATLDGRLELYELDPLEIVWSAAGEPGSRYASVIFSPDSAFLAATGFGRKIQVWDAHNGKLVMTLTGHQGIVYSASFNPSGTQLVTGSSDDTARIWDFVPRREVSVIASPQGTGAPEGSRRAVYSPDGLWLAAGHGDQGAIGIWDANNGAVVWMLTPKSLSGAVASVVFHPGGQVLAAGDVSGNIRMWDLTAGKVLGEWKAHEGAVAVLHSDRGGNRLISLGTDGIIKEWDASNGDLLRLLGAVVVASYSDSIRFAASSDDRYLLKPTWWGALRLVDIETGQDLQTYRGQVGVVEDMAFSNSSQLIASTNDESSGESTVIVWDASSAKKLFVLAHPLAPAVGLAFSPDDQLLATVSLDATLRLFDLSTGGQTLVLEDVTVKRPNGVTFSPDGKMVVVTDEEGIYTYYVRLEDVVALANARLSRGFTAEECVAFAIGQDCLKDEQPQLAVTAVSAAGKHRLVCFLPDFGGIWSSMWNQVPYEGMVTAAEHLGWDTLAVEHLLPWDLSANLDKINKAGCDLIIVSAFDEATLAVPDDHPEKRYLFVVPDDETQTWENVWTTVYEVDQASFLAGYLAAAMTRSGKVGIFGGAPFPAVIRFMDGFALGIEHYNRRHLAQVELIGWQVGGGGSQPLFTGFSDPEIGLSTTQSLVSQGADIIFPVAGQDMAEAASEAALTSPGVWVIGVDEDWAANNPRYTSITLTSVIKYIDKPVWWAMQAVDDGSFSGGLRHAHLKNGGVGLAPYYELDALIPEQVKGELEQIKGEIIAGKLQTFLPDGP